MNNKNINEFKRVNKTRARKLYNNGGKVYLLPCLIRPDFNNKWIVPFEIVKGENDFYDFDKIINQFEYYNCTWEMGRQCAYYII